jgi:hypothetical protein
MIRPFHFDEKQFLIDPVTTIQYATLCGETADRFLDADHKEFQAPPTFIASLSGGRMLPIDFPRFGIGMDAVRGSNAFSPFVPVRPSQARHTYTISTPRQAVRVA